jgi:hypothetical protein
MDGLFYCGVPIGCVLTYGLVSDFKRHAREFRRDQLGWREYAARRGFQYTGGAMSYPFRVNHRIDGHVDTLPLHCTTGFGVLHMPTTTIAARATAPIEGRLYVSCDEMLSRGRSDALAKRVDHPDPDFNGGIFGIKATSADSTSILVARVRTLLVRMSQLERPSLSFRCDRDVVAVEWIGHDPVPSLFDIGFDVVAEACAARGRQGAYR